MDRKWSGEAQGDRGHVGLTWDEQEARSSMKGGDGFLFYFILFLFFYFCFSFTFYVFSYLSSWGWVGGGSGRLVLVTGGGQFSDIFMIRHNA